MKKSMRCTAAALFAIVGGCLGACDTAPKSSEDKAALRSDSDAAVAAFKSTDSSLDVLLAKSVAWVAFPDVGKAGFIIGASHGRGIVYTHDGRQGYASLSQGSVGLQAGAQTFRELVIFMRQSDFEKFKQGDFSLAANASAVALKPGAAATTDVSKGVIVFVETKGGLMAEAAIAGQVLKFEPMK
jgi:lipid-binding SYLF domain-containing protein